MNRGTSVEKVEPSNLILSRGKATVREPRHPTSKNEAGVTLKFSRRMLAPSEDRPAPDYSPYPVVSVIEIYQ
jgi:hypothetical protein